MSESINSPAAVTLLLKCRTQPDSCWGSEIGSLDFVQAWLKAGVIKRDSPWDGGIASGYVYKTTPLGDAWVKAICNVPMPNSVFVDEQGRVL